MNIFTNYINQVAQTSVDFPSVEVALPKVKSFRGRSRPLRDVAREMRMETAIGPPFTADTALRKVQAAEDLWNSRDPERVVLAYSVNSEWRNRTEFLVGRDQIAAFLRRKWGGSSTTGCKKTLWGSRGNRSL